MKITRNLLLAGSIAAFAAAPATYADGDKSAEASPAVEQEVEVPAEEVVIEEGETTVDEGEVVIEEGDPTGEPEVVVCEPGKEGGVDEAEIVADGEVVELVDPAVCEMTGGPEVQRGEDRSLENPDVIFQNTAVDMPGTESPVTKVETQAVLGRDEHAAEIQAKTAAAAEVEKQKKGPVAVVKEGRVFLR